MVLTWNKLRLETKRRDIHLGVWEGLLLVLVLALGLGLGWGGVCGDRLVVLLMANSMRVRHRLRPPKASVTEPCQTQHLS